MVRYTAETYEQGDYDKDVALVEAIERRVTSFSSQEDVGIKREILQAHLNYRGLRIGSNTSEVRFLPLEECNASRINNVIRERYNAAKKRMAKFGNPSRRIPNEKGLAFKFNMSGQGELFSF